MRTADRIIHTEPGSAALKHSIQKPVNPDRVAKRHLRRNAERLRLRGRESYVGDCWLKGVDR